MGNEEKVFFSLCLSGRAAGVMGNLRAPKTGEFEERQSIKVMLKISLAKNRIGKDQS